jgi:hypothetical protein
VRRIGWLLVVLLVALLALAACSSGGGTTAAEKTTSTVARYPRDGELRLNQVQVLGTHNSYHVAPQKAFADAMNAISPGVTAEWEYTHPTLTVQLRDQGIRQLELDVWADPDGRYAVRKAQAKLGLPGEPVAELKQPGLKVFHIMEYDVESTCWTFVSCLREIEAWSKANPEHTPIMVEVEAKADVVPDPLNLDYVSPIPFGPPELATIDDEIRAVFSADEIITPDVVRGKHTTLEQAVLTDGWPTMKTARGKVLFTLDNTDAVMDAYIAGHPSLAGRVMFTGGTKPGAAETAFIKLNDPIADQATIQDAVKKGYLVRTMADAGSKPAGHVAYDKRDAAIASGAQYVSTDYPVPDPAVDPAFSVALPGAAPARCNPLVGPSWCTPAAVERAR